MTALLTDEQIIVACHNHAQAATRLMGDTEERQEHLEYAERDFEEGARFARSIYEARLAEAISLMKEAAPAIDTISSGLSERFDRFLAVHAKEDKP